MTYDFYIKAGDTATPMEAYLRHADNSALDLTGAAVRFIMRAEGQLLPKVNAAAVIVDLPTAKVRYTFLPTDTDAPGVYFVNWQVTFAGGTIATVPNTGYLFLQVLPDLV